MKKSTGKHLNSSTYYILVEYKSKYQLYWNKRLFHSIQVFTEFSRDKREEDYEYDHEAFLGAEDAHEFDDLDPEESKVMKDIVALMVFITNLNMFSQILGNEIDEKLF